MVVGVCLLPFGTDQVLLRSNACVVSTSRGNVSTSGVRSLRWLGGVLELEHVASDPPGHLYTSC